ncbi:flavin reductase [Nocardioides sp. SR21]|uniref:flavin reductase n=1 Tax=Nocardioides sp. SR21 TaxID=2919501 RepID=UPI001FAABA9E|nr:flavin reductase [Nocardioides sp. SR21]
MVDPSTFRNVLSQWPSGVTVVTTLVDGVRHGMTASSFSSVSAEPPLVSVCLSRHLYSHELIASSGVFGINMLAKDQAEVARRFAGMVPDVEDRFAGESWTTAETGVPLLDSALGWLDCKVVHEYPGGDHTIFVGEVLAGHAAPRTAPLLFHSRSWGQFADVLPTAATVADGGVVASLRARSHPISKIFGTVRELAAAGVRVRLLDLTRDEPPVAVPEELKDRGTALVDTIEQRDRALELGLSTVEVTVDPANLADLDRVLAIADGAPGSVVVILDDAFDPARNDVVLGSIVALSSAGVAEIGLSEKGDTANPLRVRSLLQDAVGLARPVPLRMHLRNHDRLGLVKAIVALKSGVHHFDTTLSGLDGTVATEDLVRLFGGVEVDSPADPDLVDNAAAALRLALAPTGVTPTDLATEPVATNPVGAAG